VPKREEQAKTKFRVTTEEMFAAIVAVFTFLNWMVPVISFWWRFGFAVIFLGLVVDLCLRSNRFRDYVPSKFGRFFLSVAAIVAIFVMLWTPLRKQYAEENSSPSIVFVIGAPLGASYSPVWAMFREHYGPGPAYNCDVVFNDRDRENVKEEWEKSYPNTPLPPIGDAEKSFVHETEVDPGFSATMENFRWMPLYPDSQHYVVQISCRSGQFLEAWEVERINGMLYTNIAVRRVERELDRDPGLKEIVFGCRDPEFSPNQQLATQLPAAVSPPIPPFTLQRFELPPVAFFDGHGGVNVFASFPWKPQSCWQLLSEHAGDLYLPLEIPRNPLSTPVVIYGVLVLVLPSYGFLAFWIMGFDKDRDEEA
jgi:hypothetical protein